MIYFRRVDIAVTICPPLISWKLSSGQCKLLLIGRRSRGMVSSDETYVLWTWKISCSCLTHCHVQYMDTTTSERLHRAYDVFAELDKSFQKLTSKKIRYFDFIPYLYTLESLEFYICFNAINSALKNKLPLSSIKGIDPAIVIQTYISYLVFLK